MSQSWTDRQRELRASDPDWARREREYHRAYRAKRLAEDPDYREKARERSRRGAERRRSRIRALLTEAKDKPCVDCGVQLPPECMDLDHVRGEKKFGIADRSAYRSIAELENEIAKCDVRCPNCHRMRHYRAGEVFRSGAA